MTTETRSAAMEAMAQIDALLSYQRRAFCSHSIHREISLPQLFLLMNLHESGTRSVSELSSLLQVTPPSVSAIIDRMEERGWVARERDVADRRVVHVALTAEGRALVDELAGMRHAKLQSLLALMDDDELNHVVQAIRALRRALDRLPALQQHAT